MPTKMPAQDRSPFSNTKKKEEKKQKGRKLTLHLN
jgi:hypothetical protein